MTTSVIPPSAIRRSVLDQADRNRRVYRPQADARLLAEVLATIDLGGLRVLDLCTGSGAVAVAAALTGADVTALDSCPHAVATVRRIAAETETAVRVVHSDLVDFTETGFDVVTCNPPYVPTLPGTESSADGPRHAWNAGVDGRAVLDPLCAVLPSLLVDGGIALIVQSDLADTDASLSMLRARGPPLDDPVRTRHDLPPRGSGAKRTAGSDRRRGVDRGDPGRPRRCIGMTDPARRVRVIPKGPILVEGPVDVQRPDGGAVHCDRFRVAICACGFSATPPLCDASHRRRLRKTGAERRGPPLILDHRRSAADCGYGQEHG